MDGVVEERMIAAMIKAGVISGPVEVTYQAR
jgi:hypothetical protein